MEAGKSHAASLDDVIEKAVEVDQIVSRAKKLSEELIATVDILNSAIEHQEPSDGN